MNLLDIGLLVLFGLMVWLGSSQRPVRQASASIGAIAGLLLGALLYRRLAFLATNSGGRTMVLGLLILAAGFVCYDIFLTVGRKLEHSFHLRKTALTVRTRVVSAAIAGSTGLIIIWLTLGVFSTLALPAVQQQLHSSALVGYINRTATLPAIFQDAANLLTPFNAPQTFIGTEPSFDKDITVSRNFTELDGAITKASPSVFKVTSWGCGATSLGSGFLTTSKNIVTNAHVIAGATRISVQPKGSDESYIAQPILFDPGLDLAVLSISVELPQKPLAFHSGAVAAGDIGSVLGYPGGNAFQDNDAIILESLAAKGYDIYGQSAVTRTIYAMRANVVPGNSGGPVIDTAGAVLGLVFGHSTTQNHTAYALTANQIEPSIATALKQNTVVSSGSCEN
jgi:S1-C subfamily serine protease